MDFFKPCFQCIFFSLDSNFNMTILQSKILFNVGKKITDK